MLDYDATLKVLLQCPSGVAMRELSGAAVAKWLNIELPKVQNLRVDMVGETADGELIQMELQSGNDREMRDRKETVRRIVERIGELEPVARRDRLEQLLILARAAEP